MYFNSGCILASFICWSLHYWWAAKQLRFELLPVEATWLKKNSLPPVNWRWVEEGDGYVGRLQPPGQPLVVNSLDWLQHSCEHRYFICCRIPASISSPCSEHQSPPAKVSRSKAAAIERQQSYSPSSCAASPLEAITMAQACQLCQVVDHEQPPAGLTCKAQAAHFVCSSCFQAHVAATVSVASFTAMGCRVYCPAMGCEAGLLGQQAGTEMQQDIAYTDQQVSDHVDNDVWSRYLSAAQPAELSQDIQQGQGGPDQEQGQGGGPGMDPPGKLPPHTAPAAAVQEVRLDIQPAWPPAAAVSAAAHAALVAQQQAQAMDRMPSRGQACPRHLELHAADSQRKRRAKEESVQPNTVRSMLAGAWPWTLPFVLAAAVMGPLLAENAYPDMVGSYGKPAAVCLVILIVMLYGLRWLCCCRRCVRPTS